MLKKKQKRILILGGFSQHCEAIKHAKECGHYVIVADYLKNSPGKKLADESYLISITDVDSLVSLCRERNVDGVMTYCIDPGQKPYQQICERLGLPCYGTKEQFDILTNKDLFYQACIANKVDVIPRYDVSDVNKAEELAQIDFPVVVKPVDSRASKGFSVCWSKEYLADSIRKALIHSERKKIIFEKYIAKDEVCAKYFVCDGNVFLTSFSDTYSYSVKGEKVSINGKFFPSKHYEAYKNTTDVKIRNMVKNLGIKNGPLSFTAFFDDGKFRFFDPSFRLGGAQQWRIEANVLGVDQSQCMTNFAITGTMGDIKAFYKAKKGFENQCGAMLFVLAKIGTIGRITGINEALKVDSVIGSCISHFEGETIKEYGTSDHVIAYIHLVSNDKNKIKEDMLKIQSLISVTDNKGTDMLLPHFDVNLI